jgi:DNA-binding Xre family transcriptional regulator
MATTHDYREAVAVVVETAIIARGISRKRLSELTGIARTTLNRCLDGHSPLNVEQLKSISDLIFRTPSDIAREAEDALAAGAVADMKESIAA